MKIRQLFFLLFFVNGNSSLFGQQEALLRGETVQPFQIWLSTEVEGEIAKNVVLDFEQGHIFDSFSNYTSVYLLSDIYFKYTPDLSLGFGLAVSQAKKSHAVWAKSITPYFYLDYEFLIGGLKSYFDVTVRYRTIDTVKNREGFSLSLYIDVISTDHGAMYIGNDVFYNYNGTHSFDEWWPAVGFTGTINQYLKWDFYYIFDYFRPSGKKSWDHTHVVGAEISACF